MTADDVLDYWFGDWDDEAPVPEDDPQSRRYDPQSRRWWGKSPEVDREIRDRFGTLHAEVAAGERAEWRESPRGLLACVIVLDQFSRVLHRDSARAFAYDRDAQELTAKALARAWDRDLRRIERQFLYMPLMHAEDRAAQRKSLMLFEALAAEAEEAGVRRADYYRRTVRHAQDHKAIIDRFGRYPHRNFAMERTSTPEELAYLEGDGPSF